MLDELLREGLLETGDLVLFNRSVTQSVRQSVRQSSDGKAGGGRSLCVRSTRATSTHPDPTQTPSRIHNISTTTTPLTTTTTTHSRCETMGVVGAAVCLAAKLYGRYDHLGVVVRDEDGRLQLLDAGFNGVQSYDLRERVRRSKAHDIAVRRLHVQRTPALEAAARAYAQEVAGQTYKQGFFQMAASGVVTPAQWRRERLYAEVRRLEGRVRQLTRDLQRGRATLTPLERAALEKAVGTARAQRDAAMGETRWRWR